MPVCYFKKRRVCSAVLAIVFLIAGGISAVACSRKSSGDDYIVQVRDGRVTVLEFNQSLEAATEEAFPGERNIDSADMSELRMRVLNQLTEELIIKERAKDLALQVTEAEIEKAVAAIKADYPDDTFEEVLLENAISLKLWKQKLAVHLLVRKVIAKELIDKVEITSEDVAGYYQEHYPEGVPEDADDLNQRIVKHLRQQKAEQMYRAWMETLQHTYKVKINQQQWTQLIDADSLKD